MKVLIDTNVLVSAFIFPGSLPFKCVAIAGDCHTLVLCDYVLNETKQVVAKKWPDVLASLENFFKNIPCHMISAPDALRNVMKDPKDMPILNAAIKSGVDIIVSGDKHFLEIADSVGDIKIMSPREFWEFCQR